MTADVGNSARCGRYPALSAEHLDRVMFPPSGVVQAGYWHGRGYGVDQLDARVEARANVYQYFWRRPDHRIEGRLTHQLRATCSQTVTNMYGYRRASIFVVGDQLVHQHPRHR